MNENANKCSSEDGYLCECRNPECGLLEVVEPESVCPGCGDVMEPVDESEPPGLFVEGK